MQTSHITRDRDPETGRVMVNQYIILDELGKGTQAHVRRARDVETGRIWAVKIVKRWARKRLPVLRTGLGVNNSAAINTGLMDEKIRREIAILKKCNHDNIVRLREVIDDGASKTIFLVLEYMAGGEIVWRSPDSAEPAPAMTVDQCRRTMRDVVLGLEYLHHQGIIHRDIKPANLLCTHDRQTVKITDFGVSYLSSRAQQDGIESISTSHTTEELKKTAGSPAFYAPELCHPGDISFSSFSSLDNVPVPKPILTKAIDVWALGVTLYCLLFGKTPFTAETEYVLWSVIMKTEYVIPDFMGSDLISTTEGQEAIEIRHLLSRLMEKDPAKRITLSEVKRHPWLLRNLPSASNWIQMHDISDQVPVTVSVEEVASAVAIKDKLKRKFEKFVKVIGRRGSSSQINSPSEISSGSPGGASFHSPRSPIFAFLQADSGDPSRPSSPSDFPAQVIPSQRYSSPPLKSFSVEDAKNNVKSSKNLNRNSLKRMIASLRGKRSEPSLLFSTSPQTSPPSISDESWNMISLTESIKNLHSDNLVLRRATSSSGLQNSSPLINSVLSMSNSDDDMQSVRGIRAVESKFHEDDDFSSVEEELTKSNKSRIPYILPSEFPGISDGLGLTLPKDKSFASGLMTLTRSISSTAVNERPRLNSGSPRRKSYEPSSSYKHHKSPSEELGIYDDAETPETGNQREWLTIPSRKH